ncbi:uncharacterized protein F5Z01DRAFT_156177 [Emericellopsis atlantica]|uniref:Uncharacterized protein n=1 Tax=Emericellopsis atlantica TaxID=2614577 RepID=A0A9P7ZJD3_9HYPO|nr:uncharacterized protein F5Z01DRAFT_156177 [Emericellopsis atlantica]KAG9253193.1 hypothetical protein F5Z01DRAFT_156177 [Emericellopsis atlantica]
MNLMLSSKPCSGTLMTLMARCICIGKTTAQEHTCRYDTIPFFYTLQTGNNFEPPLPSRESHAPLIDSMCNLCNITIRGAAASGKPVFLDTLGRAPALFVLIASSPTRLILLSGLQRVRLFCLRSTRCACFADVRRVNSVPPRP